MIVRRRALPLPLRTSCRPYLASISGIFATGSTRSTAPVMIALRGMPSYSASSGSCAMTSPPFSLTAFSPRLPSPPVPERITQIARSPSSSANERRKKSNGRRAPWRSARFREAQRAVADREIGTRRNEIDMLALERHPVRRLLYFHRRMAGQQIDHHARMRRIEMLDQNEGHAGAGRERVEQPADSIKAAGRGAEPDDREAVSPSGEPRFGDERRLGGARAVRACRGRCPTIRCSSYHEALHCCDTGFFRRCSCPKRDGAPVNGCLHDSLLLLTPRSRGRHVSIFDQAAANPPS